MFTVGLFWWNAREGKMGTPAAETLVWIVLLFSFSKGDNCIFIIIFFHNAIVTCAQKAALQVTLAKAPILLFFIENCNSFASVSWGTVFLVGDVCVCYTTKNIITWSEYASIRQTGQVTSKIQGKRDCDCLCAAEACCLQKMLRFLFSAQCRR